MVHKTITIELLNGYDVELGLCISNRLTPFPMNFEIAFTKSFSFVTNKRDLIDSDHVPFSAKHYRLLAKKFNISYKVICTLVSSRL